MRSQFVGRFVGCALSLICLGSAAQAAPVLTLENVPATYTPGDAFTFDVRLVGAEDLASYDVTIFLNSSAGIAGTDFKFTGAVKGSPYVFTADDGIFAAVLNADMTRITLNDLLILDPGDTLTVAGVNDTIAHVSVMTTAAAGTLSLMLETTTLMLDTFEFAPIPEIASILDASPSATSRADATVIPTPSSAAMGFILFVIMSAAQRRRHVSRSLRAKP